MHQSESREAAYSARVGEALKFAADLHAGQRRKSKDEPYLSHLLRVAALVAHNGGDENQIIAAALHDAAEDQGGAETLSAIENLFGRDVAGLVLECSDSLGSHGQIRANWRDRKEAYLSHVTKRGPCRASLVEAADKLANLEDLVEDYEEMGEDVLLRFSGGPAGVRWYYRRLNEVLMPQAEPRIARMYWALLLRLTPASN